MSAWSHRAALPHYSGIAARGIDACCMLRSNPQPLVMFSRCRVYVGGVMPVSKAMEIRMKLAASSLHLQCTGAANRGACSAEHTRAILAIIEGATLTAVEKSDLMLYITEHLLSCGAWEQKDLSLLLNAFEAAHKPRRRPSQNFLDRMCDYFLEEERQRCRAIGVQGMESSACELIQRLHSIGAKRLDEHSRKRVLSIWLLLRGDGRSAGVAGRAVAAEQFRRRLEKSMRDWEPQEYIAELPSLDVYQTEHRGMFAMAFPIDKPKPIPDADLAEVIFIDGLLRCRGGGNAYETQAFQFAQPQGLQLGQQGCAQQVSQAPMSVADMFQLAMQQFGLLRRQSAPHVELLAPRGRPMRALSNVQSQFPISGGKSRSMARAVDSYTVGSSDIGLASSAGNARSFAGNARSSAGNARLGSARGRRCSSM